MEKRIELEMRSRPASEITSLNLDNCRSTQVVGLTDEFANLEVLSLINVGLTNLKGFPKLPELRKLELSENRLSGGLENLAGCPNLKSLKLSGNKIKDLKILEPLKSLRNLRSLDLFNCDLTESETHREDVFRLLPQLQYLNSFDREDQEQDPSDDELGGDEDEEDEELEGEEDDDEENSDDEDEETDEDEEEVDEDDDDEVQILNGSTKTEEENGNEDGPQRKKRKHEETTE